MIEYTVGQNVVHPNHGIGEVVNITRMDLVEGFKRYYVIEFARNLTSHIPMRKVEDLGVRSTMSQSKIKRVFQTLEQEPKLLPEHHKKRRTFLEDLLQSGHPVKIAQAVRELTWRREYKGLSTTDDRFLSQGKEMLITEIAVVTDHEANEVRSKIEKALAYALEAKEAQSEH